MKTPQEVANDLYWSIPDDEMIPDEPSGADLRALMVKAIEADRAQRPTRDLNAFIEAYENFDGDDLSVLVHAWEGGDTLCWESKTGLHQDSDGSCDLCGEKNR